MLLKRPKALRLSALAVLVTSAAACGMAGFGGSLQLNITDRQTRQLLINIDGGASDARLLQLEADGEVQIGTGTARIERYVVQRATFGSGISVGYFLCAKPCADPLNSYLVAYSPDQLFRADGQLELRFRIVSAGGTSQELTRVINAEMLPSLWEQPTIDAGPGGR